LYDDLYIILEQCLISNRRLSKLRKKSHTVSIHSRKREFLYKHTGVCQQNFIRSNIKISTINWLDSLLSEFASNCQNRQNIAQAIVQSRTIVTPLSCFVQEASWLVSCHAIVSVLLPSLDAGKNTWQHAHENHSAPLAP
jgi:hypothetical protein